MRRPDPRAQPPGSGTSASSSDQRRLLVRSEEPEEPMNPLRRIEQEVLALGREWARLELQKRLQEQCDAMPLECAQTGQPLKNTRWRKMELDTVSGKVELRARHGRQAQHKKWVCPARVAWGLSPYERKTPELQARLAYTATVVGSYVEAETMAAPLG